MIDALRFLAPSYLVAGIILMVAYLALSGCAAVDVVTDQGVKLQLAYCDLSSASRAAVARQYLERLPEGYDIDIDCPGDREG